jgi:hypothetical protein
MSLKRAGVVHEVLLDMLKDLEGWDAFLKMPAFWED